jgi:hypothetical protein
MAFGKSAPPRDAGFVLLDGFDGGADASPNSGGPHPEAVPHLESVFVEEGLS